MANHEFVDDEAHDSPVVLINGILRYPLTVEHYESLFTYPNARPSLLDLGLRI